jgi:hypothetical protein
MKTAEQFLEECKAKWTLNTPESFKQAMIEALIMYAEQAIDKCAEKVWDCVDSYDDGMDSDDYSSPSYCISEDPIKEVKTMLK